MNNNGDTIWRRVGGVHTAREIATAGCPKPNEMNNNGDTQVIIYLDAPRGQLIQTSYSTWKTYYRLLGWQLQGPASELPKMPKVKIAGLQGGLL